MPTRERLLAAITGQDVDYTPLVLHFWSSPRHPRAVWTTARARLGFYRQRGWDTYVIAGAGVSPLPEVTTKTAFEVSAGQRVFRQTWHTPAGDLHERLRVTDDWLQELPPRHPLLDDFRTARYLEYPLKTAADLAALPYLFPRHNPADEAAMATAHAQARALADEFAVPLVGYLPDGLDWLIWLFPAQEAVLRAALDPDFVGALLAPVNAAYQQRLGVLLDLGVDAVLRRGWYESTDFWSPALYAQFARPPLLAEVDATHQAGIPFIYQMDSGIMPLLDELAAVPFDCLLGADPATSQQDTGTIRARLPGKALWGGLSGPLQLGRGTPAETEAAVERAFAACGNRGFVLGPGVGIRHDWPWANIEACDRAWRRLR